MASIQQFDIGLSSTQPGFVGEMFKTHDLKHQSAIPAIVEEYNPSTGYATVRPLIKATSTDLNGQQVEHTLPSVEVHIIRSIHGGYRFEMPLFVGDTGWLVAGDRNAHTAMGKNDSILERDQSEERVKNAPEIADDFSLTRYSNGFFIPDSWATKNNTNSNVVLEQIKTGNKIELSEDNVELVARDTKLVVKDVGVLIYKGATTLVLDERGLTIEKTENKPADPEPEPEPDDPFPDPEPEPEPDDPFPDPEPDPEPDDPLDKGTSKISITEDSIEMRSNGSVVTLNATGITLSKVLTINGNETPTTIKITDNNIEYIGNTTDGPTMIREVYNSRVVSNKARCYYNTVTLKMAGSLVVGYTQTNSSSTSGSNYFAVDLR